MMEDLFRFHVNFTCEFLKKQLPYHVYTMAYSCIDVRPFAYQ